MVEARGEVWAWAGGGVAVSWLMTWWQSELMTVSTNKLS